MTNFFFKLACLLTGADYQRALQAPAPSRVKVGALAMAIMVPTLIWMGSTYLLVTNVLQKNMGAGIAAALFTGTIILILETLIVKATGTITLAIVRIVLGACAAAIGAIIIDEIVFVADVDQQMELVRREESVKAGEKAAAHFAKLHKLGDLEGKIATAEQHFKALDSIARGEADGTIGSRKRGVDVVTLFKQKQADDAKKDFESLVALQQKLGHEMAAIDSMAQAMAEIKFNPHSLLKRIKALFQLVTEDAAMFWLYTVFTIMMFILEFLVIILKLSWEKSALEEESEALEQLHKERTKRHLHADSPLGDPLHVPHVAGMMGKIQHFNKLL